MLLAAITDHARRIERRGLPPSSIPSSAARGSSTEIDHKRADTTPQVGISGSIYVAIHRLKDELLPENVLATYGPMKPALVVDVLETIMSFEEMSDSLLHLAMQVKQLVFSYRITTFESLRKPFAKGLEPLIRHVMQPGKGGVEAAAIIMDVQDMRIPHPRPDVQAEMENCRKILAAKVLEAGAAGEWTLRFINTARMRYLPVADTPGDSDDDFTDDFSDI